jgi:CRP-like cAMP-binding protein
MYEHPLFETLNKEEAQKFTQIFKKKEIPVDTVLIKEGENGNSAFLLIKGKVSVSKKNIYNEDYIVTIIDAGRGEFFGEINLIDEGKRTSTIKTIENSIILEVTRNDLKNFMDQNPKIGYKIIWHMAKNCANHLRKADNDVITLFNALVEVVEND